MPTPLPPFPLFLDESVYNGIYVIISYPCILGMGVRQLVYLVLRFSHQDELNLKGLMSLNNEVLDFVMLL